MIKVNTFFFSSVAEYSTRDRKYALRVSITLREPENTVEFPKHFSSPTRASITQLKHGTGFLFLTGQDRVFPNLLSLTHTFNIGFARFAVMFTRHAIIFAYSTSHV